LPKSVLADEKGLIITEIMVNPPSGETEWIELYANQDINFVRKEGNKTDNKKIKNFYICTKKGADGCDVNRISFIYFPEEKESLSIKKGEFFIIARDNEAFKEKYAEKSKVIVLKSDSKFDLLGNTSENAFVAVSNDEEIEWESSVSYYNSDNKIKEGYSLEKDESSFRQSYIIGGTPGEKNSEKPKPKEYSSKIRINEILPNPSGDESENEYIELYNFSGDDIDLEGWEIKDSSETGKYIFSKGSIIKKDNYIEIYRKDFKFALNNSDEMVYLLDPNGKIIDKTNYADSAKEDISYNFDGAYWRWSRFLTPDKENQFNNLPTSKVKIEKKVYENMLAEFRVSAKDKDGDKLKFTWDFGDGHKSYLKNTKHKYEKKGIYTVSLKISDGSEDIFETFEIEVGKFPKSELKIVGIKANPKGKDTDLETIKVKNSSKKKINLKGWSIATGWKNLYNHPINKKLVLKSGETKEITRKYSLFALNNKQAKIELRRPDGSVASKVKYSKKKGIQDDEIYEKTENGWDWIETQTDTDNAENTQDDTEKSVADEENQNNQEDNMEIQPDEPVENGEVLGIEMVSNESHEKDEIQFFSRENKHPIINFFAKSLQYGNQKINYLLNFIFG